MQSSIMVSLPCFMQPLFLHVELSGHCLSSSFHSKKVCVFTFRSQNITEQATAHARILVAF